MERYYQKEIETADREQILAWQNERLVKQVRHVWDNVPYYRKKMEEKGVTPEDIQGLKDLHKLPFLTKDDLREAYPYGLLAKPLKDCVRIQSTSGTTGRRVVAFYTQHDIDLWEDCCARAIMAAGGTSEDVCHVSYGYGLFTGGPRLQGGGAIRWDALPFPCRRAIRTASSSLWWIWNQRFCAVRPLTPLFWRRASTSGGFGIRLS